MLAMAKRKKKKKAAGKQSNPWRSRLIRLREALGAKERLPGPLTQTEAAKRIAVGQGVWAAWENGHRSPSRQSILLIEMLERSI